MYEVEIGKKIALCRKLIAYPTFQGLKEFVEYCNFIYGLNFEENTQGPSINDLQDTDLTQYFSSKVPYDFKTSKGSNY